MVIAKDQQLLSTRFYQNVKAFIADVLCRDEVVPEDFITGTQRVEFFADLIEREHQITPREVDLGGTTYEEALLSRLIQRNELGTLVLLGGLGAGKTTSIRYVLHLLRTRRESLRITKCMEHCVICTRQPLYVDCIEIDRDISVEDAISFVTQKIRDTIYEQIIFEWLARNDVSKTLLAAGPIMHTIRRLIITNDLRLWADEHRINVDLLSPPELDAKMPILNMKPDDATLTGLVSRFEQHLIRLDGWLGRMHHNQKDNIAFTLVLLKFYLSKCPPQNPQNFLVIDNLDALPTRHIEEVAKVTQKLSSVDRNFLVLLLLRPSSILTPGHIRTTEVWYHYGPNCYEMLLHRLEKHVLCRTRSELLGKEVNDQGLARSPFLTSPTEEELNFFLLVAFLYANILAAGHRHLSEGQPDVKFDKEHSILTQVRVPSGTAESIARTLGALVGTCARYANEQLLRYFGNIYIESSEIFDTLGRLGHKASKTALGVPYKLIMDSLIFDAAADVPISEHIANLYSPTRRGSNNRLPSLVKIRILKFLRRWKRAMVRDVIRHLSLYGVPAEIGIEALNSLHDKNRLLLWFSENHELRSETQDGDQYVVISEHGLSYLEHVLGDFEYMWACAANMHRQNTRDARFVVRLADYENLVRNVGLTEWKQLAFRRCLGNYVRPETGTAEYGELTTLSVLYKSLSRALRSSESIFLSRSTGGRLERTQELLERLCELIGSWQERYELCFVGKGYRNVYALWRKEAKEALRRVVDHLDRSSAGYTNVVETLEELSLDDWEEPRTSVRWGRVSLDEDYVTQAARFLRSFLPFPAEWTKGLDENVARRILLDRFTNSEIRIGALLGRTLPTYRDVEESAVDVLKNIEYLLMHSEQAGVATGTGMFERLLREKDFLSAKVEALRANLIPDSPPCSAIQMSERKARFNNLMVIYRDLGQRYSAELSLDHLKISWQ